MSLEREERNLKIIKNVLKNYLKDKGFRNTPERYSILEEIYLMNSHFSVDDLYILLLNKKHFISKATIYNTIEILLDAGLIRKHQFGEKNLTGSHFEKSYFDKQHDHIIIYKDGSDKEISEIIEFCDPRIQTIKASIEEAFGIKIENHSLYFYGYKK